jgi:hypothetical protein
MEHRGPPQRKTNADDAPQLLVAYCVGTKKTAESPGRQSGERGTRAVGANSAVIRGKRNKER